MNAPPKLPAPPTAADLFIQLQPELTQHFSRERIQAELEVQAHRMLLAAKLKQAEEKGE